MKKIFIILNLLIVNQLSFSQGIQWEPTIEGAFKKAKATNRPVFIECYHPTCPVCMSLEPTFKTAEVGKFYNQKFINFKLNLSDPNHVKFLNSKKIYLPSFPMFLYFDDNREFIHQSDVENSSKSFVQTGQTALDPQKRASSYQKRYEAGEREIGFLSSYAYFLRIKTDTTNNIKVANELYNAFPKDQLSNQTSWAITKKMVMDVDNGFAKFWFDNIETAKKYETEHPGNENNALGSIIQNSLGKYGSTYSSSQIAKIKGYMNKIGAGQYADGVTWQQEARAWLREGHPDKGLAIVENMAKQFITNGQALVFLVKFLNDNSKDAFYAATAQSWLEKAKPLLKTNKDLAELNFETARLYQKAGDKANAQKSASTAQQLAVSAKTEAKNLKKFNELMADLK